MVFVDFPSQPPRKTQLQDAARTYPLDRLLRSRKSASPSVLRMSKQPIDNATIKIKRKRAPVWPHATRNMCEQVIKLLAKEELVKELSSPED